MNIDINEPMQLISTSNLESAQELYKSTTIKNIGIDLNKARIKRERVKMGIVYIINFNNDIYELFYENKQRSAQAI